MNLKQNNTIIERTQNTLSNNKLLIEKYEKLVKNIETTIEKDNVSMAIPRFLFPFQTAIRENFYLLADLEQYLAETQNTQLINLKMKRHKLSGLTLTSTEQTNVIKNSVEVKEIDTYIKKITADVKMFDSIKSTLSYYSNNIKIAIEWKQLVGG